MSSEGGKKELVEALRFALNNQINWQKYAEAKNIILFTVSGTTLVTLVSLFKDFGSNSVVSEHILTIKPTILIFFFSTLFSFVLSMLSIAANLLSSKSEALRENNRLLFISWNFVRKKSFDELVDLTSKYGLDEQVQDLIDQHYEGSKLTYKKYRFFNWGTYFYLVGLLIFVLTSSIMFLVS